MKQSLSGWTVVETLCVIAVILLLTGTVGYSARHAYEKAQVAAARLQAQALAEALDAFRFDTCAFPDRVESLWSGDDVSMQAKGVTYLNGPLPADPWGGSWNYQQKGPDHYRLVSLGSDRSPGGTGNAQDIEVIR